jgi:hypothetical protein
MKKKERVEFFHFILYWLGFWIMYALKNVNKRIHSKYFEKSQEIRFMA